VEIAQARPEMRPHAQPRGVLGDMDLERGGAGQPDEIASCRLLEVDLAAAGERAAPRGYEGQPVLAEQEALDVIRQRGLGGEAEIRAARGDRGRDVGALALLDVDGNVAMLAQETGERLRQVLRQAGGVGEEMYARAHAAGKAREIAAQRLDLVNDEARV